MTEFVAFDSHVEITGQSVLSILMALDEQAAPILAAHNLANVDPDAWYLMQDFLDALQELSQQGYFNMVSVGMKVPDVAVFPPEINTVEKALTVLGQAYQMNCRGGEIGEYTFTKTGERSGEMYCRNPYPSDFDYGLIYRVIQKYRPADGGTFSVTRDDSVPNRKSGGDACTYLISW